MYNENGNIEEWLQLFLRNDGKNVALADGLLLEKREYFGLIKLNMSCLKDVKEGAPEYLIREKEKEDFFRIVENMKKSFENWDVPPLIVEVKNDRFYVNDGRHRLERYRQMGMEIVDVVLWTTGEENKKKIHLLI